MSFDIEGAKKAGYSDAEIADYLASQSNFDAAGARTSGYSDAEIINHLSAIPASKVQSTKYDPTEGMSSYDKFMAGVGKALTDLGRGTGQLVGLVDQKSIAEAKARDVALMNTGSGTAGNIAGNIAPFLATSFIPGANTYTGAATIGTIGGLLQPQAQGNVALEKLKDAGYGGLLSVGGKAAGDAIAATYNAGKGILAPFFKKGQEGIVGRTLNRFATNADDVVNAASKQSPLPGYQQTLAEVTQDPGIANLQRAAASGDARAALGEVDMSNLQAVKNAIKNIAGDDATMAAAMDARDSAANALYGKAFQSDAMRRDLARQALADRTAAITGGGLLTTKGTAQASANIADDLSTPGLRELAKRPAFQSAIEQAKRLAADKGDEIGDPLQSLQGLHYIKLALDDMLEGNATNALGRNAKASVAGMKTKLLDEIGKIAPTYDAARSAFADMSRPINQMQVGQYLYDKVSPALEDFGAQPGARAASFAQALRNAPATVKSATGMARPLTDIMSPEQMATLEATGKVLAQRASAQNLGKAVGSNTAQNLASGNLMRQIAGPIGLPQSFSEAAVLPTLLRPVQWGMKAQEPAIQDLLAEALANPKMAADLMRKTATNQDLMVPFLKNTNRYLLLPSALGTNAAQQ